jgi:hypothetical protein
LLTCRSCIRTIPRESYFILERDNTFQHLTR